MTLRHNKAGKLDANSSHWDLRILSPSMAVIVLVLAVSSIWLPLNLILPAHATGPAVDTASIQTQTTSISLSSGSQLYMYGFATGGCCPTGDFQYGQYAAVNDLVGFRIASLAVTSSSQNSYPSQTAYNTIGGIGVSGYSSYSASFQTTSASGPELVTSNSFSVSSSNTLVVVVAVGGGAQCQQVTGLSNFQVDANTPNANPIITIGHSYLNSGSYTVTMDAFQCAAGQDPNHAGNVLGVFVFAPTTVGSGLDLSASYSLLSSGFGQTIIFAQTVSQGDVVNRTLSGTINDPDPVCYNAPPNAAYPGYFIIVQTIVPDQTYRVVGIGGRGGATPEVQGYLQVGGQYRITQTEQSFQFPGCNLETFTTSNSGLNDFRIITIGSSAGRVDFHSKSSCFCSLSDGAGIFFSVIVSSAPGPLGIQTVSLPDAELHAPYSSTLAASGGTAPYSWSVTTGQSDLTSAGISLSSGGLLSGTPTNIGRVAFTVSVTDSFGATASRQFVLNISQGPLIVCSNSSCLLPYAPPGRPYSYTLQVQGGQPAFQFSRISGALPEGLSFSASGTISGTPTIPGFYLFAIMVTDSIGGNSNQGLSIIVPPLVMGVSPMVGSQNGGTSVTITGIGFTGASSVSFGTATASCTAILFPACSVQSDTKIVLTTPSTSQVGTVNVVVSVGGYFSAGYCPSGTFPGIPTCAQYVYLSSAVQTCSPTKQFDLATFGPFNPDITLQNPSGVGGTVTLSPDVFGNLGASARVCITTQGFDLKQFVLNVNVTSDASFSLKATGGIAYHKSLSLFDKPLTLGVIPVGPVSIRVIFDPEISIDASVTSSFEFGVNQGSIMQLSVKCNSGTPACSTSKQLMCTNGATAFPCIKPTKAVSIQGSLSAFLDLNSSFLIYGIVGPSVIPRLGFELDGGLGLGAPSGPICNGLTEGSVPNLAWWGLCGKMSVDIGMDLSFLGFRTLQFTVGTIEGPSVLIAASVSVNPATATVVAGHVTSFSIILAGSLIPSGCKDQITNCLSTSPGPISWRILETNCGALENQYGPTTKYDAPATVPSSGAKCTLQATYTFLGLSSPSGVATITVTPAKP